MEKIVAVNPMDVDVGIVEGREHRRRRRDGVPQIHERRGGGQRPIPPCCHPQEDRAAPEGLPAAQGRRVVPSAEARQEFHERRGVMPSKEDLRMNQTEMAHYCAAGRGGDSNDDDDIENSPLFVLMNSAKTDDGGDKKPSRRLLGIIMHLRKCRETRSCL